MLRTETLLLLPPSLVGTKVHTVRAKHGSGNNNNNEGELLSTALEDAGRMR